MSDTAQRITWECGKVAAERIVHALHRGCERIEIAGSLRRLKSDIGDIEIVAIPKRVGLMEDSALDPILQEMVASATLHRIKNGEKYKQFIIMEGVAAGCKLDLFLAEPSTWGVIFTIRTGPAEFSHRMVTQRWKGGTLPDELAFKDGRIWQGVQWNGATAIFTEAEMLDTPTEAEVFRVCEMKWVEPKDRK